MIEQAIVIPNLLRLINMRLVCDSLAEFYGTIKEFKKYIGPRVKNIVPPLTKKRKKELSNVCQHCGTKAELQAAHKKGKSRNNIIDIILSKYHIDEQNIKIDLDLVDREIIEAHMPIDDHFLFLCPKCHQKYDRENETAKSINTKTEQRKVKKFKKAEQDNRVVDADVKSMVRAYCEKKGLSKGTTYSACSRVNILMKMYPTRPTEEQVRADLMAAGKNAKTITDTIWAVRIWAAAVS